MLGRHDLAQFWALLSIVSTNDASKNTVKSTVDALKNHFTPSPVIPTVIARGVDYLSRVQDTQTLGILEQMRQRAEDPTNAKITLQTRSRNALPPSKMAKMSKTSQYIQQQQQQQQKKHQLQQQQQQQLHRSPHTRNANNNKNNISNKNQQKRRIKWSIDVPKKSSILSLSKPPPSLLMQQAQLLHGYGMNNQRAALEKALPSDCAIHDSKSFEHHGVARCKKCGLRNEGGRCTHCAKAVVECGVCRLPCRGQFLSCQNCGHGGHFAHMMEWFRDNDECCAGCNCLCKITEETAE
eukprot:TRINITY_DN3598_c0_g1_i1.p1 TRINITY_DN3598_c0_g1~~TRINITY_DN3598_c0_g1_i1.p1  ORF type:complete len:295 (+),score=81.77 TRINITY_DN3598_c0_g1_i1:475-1359(+)